MQRNQTRAGCDGFTLIEVLAALAIASVIIMASTALVHNVALFFDRGTRSVTEAERLMLAVERLAGDFSSARFVSRSYTQNESVRPANGRWGSDTLPCQLTVTSCAPPVFTMASSGSAIAPSLARSIEHANDAARRVS